MKKKINEAEEDIDIIRPDSAAAILITLNNELIELDNSKNLNNISAIDNIDDLNINKSIENEDDDNTVNIMENNQNILTTKENDDGITLTTIKNNATLTTPQVNGELNENDLEQSVLLEKTFLQIDNIIKESDTIEGIEELDDFKENLLLVCRHNLTNASALVRKAALLLMEYIGFTTINMDEFLESQVKMYFDL